MVVFEGFINGVSKMRGSICALSMLSIVATIWLTPSPTYAVPGCCVCFNCDTEMPFCTDQMATPPDCVTLCAGFGCPASTFSTVDTCFTGCGSFDPFPTPTPTFTPTPTITPTETNTVPPTDTLTPAPTPTPVYCCQGRTPDRCGISVPSNEENCEADETPVVDAACLAGSCQIFTPTFTQTLTRTPTSTRPPPTPTPTPTETPTKTLTPELKFTVDPYACYKVKSADASASKGQEVPVDDVLLPPKMTKINKPFFACAPANVKGSGDPKNPGTFLTCYKGKDTTKVDGPEGAVRNLFDMAGLDVDLTKGQLICMPSFGSFAAPPPAPTATVSGPTATPGSAPTNTP